MIIRHRVIIGEYARRMERKRETVRLGVSFGLPLLVYVLGALVLAVSMTGAL